MFMPLRIFRKILGKDDTIICPWCNKPIKNGSEITLYSLVDEDFRPLVPKKVRVFREEPPTILVGCIREECWSHKQFEVAPAGILVNGKVTPYDNALKKTRYLSLPIKE
jgi:hypothetical protein